MVNSDLVATLQTLTKQEQNSLMHFLQSPYFTNGKKAAHQLQLVELIFNVLSAGEPENPALHREALYTAIYPGNSKFVEQTINNLVSSTLGLVRKFIVVEMAARPKKHLYDATQIINFFLEKGAYDLCQKHLQKAERKKELEDSSDNLDFLHNWQFESAKGIFLGMQTEQKGDFNMKQSLLALEEYYLTERLETLTSIFNLNRFTPILQKKEPEQLLAEIDSWAKKPCFKNPVIQLSRKVLLFLNATSQHAEKEFDEFMALLSKHEKTLSIYHLKRMEAFAYNFCSRRFDQKIYRDILFDLYRRRIKPQRLSKEKTIQATEFLSMVKTGLLQNEFELVQSLLDTLKTQIKGPQPSEKYYQFGLAMLYFYMEKFDEAQAIVFRLNFHDTTYKFMSKVLEIKLIYENTTDYTTQLNSRLIAFKATVSRDGAMAADKLLGFRNFGNLMIRLKNWHIHPDKNWGLLRDILQDVQQSAVFAERIWVEKKLTELLNDAPPGN